MRVFNATDRCDRCGAQAHHSASKPAMQELLFCNHHYQEHREALFAGYWLIESSISYEPTPAAAYTE